MLTICESVKDGENLTWMQTTSPLHQILDTGWRKSYMLPAYAKPPSPCFVTHAPSNKNTWNVSAILSPQVYQYDCLIKVKWSIWQDQPESVEKGEIQHKHFCCVC